MSYQILTITTQYLDLIASGEKKIEYRRDIPYYDKVLRPAPKTILFHNRHGKWLLCKIGGVRKINRPAKLNQSKFIDTRKCFAISIASAELLSERPPL